MGIPTWPELELSPLEERPLLQAARLRRFGVNYLQDAVCPGLGLLAHLDGSHVRLLALPPRSASEMGDVARGRVVAEIDLEPGRRIQNHGDDQEPVRNHLGRDDGPGQASAAASQGPFRGLSWGQPIHSSGAASSARGGSSMLDMEPKGLLPGRSGGVGVVGGDGGCGENGDGDRVGGESVCHIAVACGSEVRLWKVSRVSCDTGVAGVAAAIGDEGKPEMRFRYSAVSVMTDWQCTTHGNGGSEGIKGSPSLRGNIRCLSFRPCRGPGSAGVPTGGGIVGREGAVPLAAWCDGGAAVLGHEGSRVVLPAPVVRERACGSWSGCGRRLAVTSGGEIRVYNDPSQGKLLPEASVVAKGGIEKAGVPGQRAANTGSTWLDPDPKASAGSVDPTDLPLATEVRGGWLSADAEAKAAVAEVAANAFRTVLCVEAAMYDGGTFSSPGSSPGGSPRSSSRLAAPMRPPSSPRRGPQYQHSPSGRPMAAITSVSRTRSEGGVLPRGEGSSQTSSSTNNSALAVTAPATSTRGSSSPLVMGNMRAMCPAGPLAFFGATDGGLGLDSVFASNRTLGMGEPLIAGSGDGRKEMGAQGLLGAIVDTSNATRTAASAAAGGDGFEKSTRRSGFRHVLPGENWLAGSLRPSSRRLRDSPPRQRHPSSSSAASDENDAGTAAIPPDAEAPSLPRPVSEPEVLDLRGKLGEGVNGRTGGVGEEMGPASVASVHPLFRLSLPGGAAPMIPPITGSNTTSRGEGWNCDTGASVSINGDTAATPVRSPWLVRVSCKNKSNSRSSDIGGSGDSVKVKALASLPPGLASPDLIASSEDGCFVAVGSHACDLVACFRLELRSSDTCHGDHPEELDAKRSAERSPRGARESGDGGNPNVDSKGGSRRRKQRLRQAVPLCTLRLPHGYRAKGLLVVGETKAAGDRRHEAAGASAARNGSSVSGKLVAEDVVVLVLAGYAVPHAEAAAGGASRSRACVASPGEYHRRGSNGEEIVYRTVLLRFLLPSGSPAGDIHDLASVTPVAGPSEPARGEHVLRDGREANKAATDGPKYTSPPNVALGGGTGTGIGGRRLSASSGRGADDESQTVCGCADSRLEAVLLQAIAGVERRMDDRFNRMETMLSGVCNRLGILEDWAKGQSSAR